MANFVPKSRLQAILVIILVVALTGVIMSIKSPAALVSKTSTGLSPSIAQSAAVEEILSRAKADKYQPAIIVFRTKDASPITTSQYTELNKSLQEAASNIHSYASPISHTKKPDIAFAIIQVDVSSKDDTKTAKQVTDIRKSLKSAPGNITVQVTGGPAFTTDIANVFNGADTKLLIATVLVVAILLIFTYRSPFLWLIPLTVVGIAEQLTTKVVALFAPHLGFVIDPAASGITSVLVFGAGTDYSLLLIARYKDELHRNDSRFIAMSKAWKRTFEAIAASGFTVILSLLTLLLASVASTRAIGISGAIGIAIALVFALFVLPAALLIFGRGVFWPRVPRKDSYNTANKSIWGKVGRKVSKKPGMVLSLGVLVLLVCSLGASNIKIGLSQTQEFRVKPEAVAGQETLAKALPAGETAPLTILVSSNNLERVKSSINQTTGVSSLSQDNPIGKYDSLSVVLSSAPSTTKSYDTLKTIRNNVKTIGDGSTLIGGQIAQTYDLKQASARDQKLIIPIILLLVFVILIVLLRALVAPIVLIISVLLTFGASLGISWLIFNSIYKIPALDTGVLLLSFLFLVALGVDYNIFLSTRAREETIKSNPKDGMLKSLAVTGGVITSAGILLASVFAVLGVLPLITLTQIGVIVGIGVLLDTLLVRTVLVPASAFILNNAFWYPNTLGKKK